MAVLRKLGCVGAAGVFGALLAAGCAAPGPAPPDPGPRPERAPARSEPAPGAQSGAPIPDDAADETRPADSEPAPPDAQTEPESTGAADNPAVPEPAEPAGPGDARPVAPPSPAGVPEPDTPGPAGTGSGADPAARVPRFDLTGSVTLTGGSARVGETVVYFVPDAAGSPVPAPETREIVTRDKQLRPTVLAVPAGSTVRFPNHDPILHNVFSVSADNAFDLGVYGPGESPEARLAHPGVVNVYCNVHHDMHAHVLVVETPHHIRAGTDGRFRIAGIAAGRGTLHAWHRQAGRWSRRIEVPPGAPVEIGLEITRPSLPPHRDKRGQSYQRRDRDPYR